MSPPEVAEALGTSLATAKREILRGRERVVRLATEELALSTYLEQIAGAEG
jgi:DNA-directed RNA polymerase specialized sigma24 family protein